MKCRLGWVVRESLEGLQHFLLTHKRWHSQTELQTIPHLSS